MIILRDISLRRGSKLLLQDTDARLQLGDHLALIGANGSGKSSLFQLLLGGLAQDAGEIDGLDGLRLAHMAQEVAHESAPAGEFVLRGDAALSQLLADLRAAERAEDYDTAASIHTQLESIDGYTAERRVEQLLRGLGFDRGARDRPVHEFSGGWRIRLNLAQALMAPSDLLLLDEPTNHLDLDATLWLQNWLQAYEGTLLMISHDRDFIDATCDRILHLEHCKLTSYRGNYSAFEKQRAERLANDQAIWAKQQRRVAEIEDFVRRFRYKATKARQAQSRLKELQRMQTVAPAHMDSPFSFNFPAPERSSDPMLSLRQANIGYDEQPVLTGVDLSLHPGSRIALLGRNGAGKSTLLKSLVGELPLLEGERLPGEHCSVGYFNQQQMEALDLSASPLLHLQRTRSEAREQAILDFLGGFNFRGDAATAPVAPLSGGEKARLALAIIAWQQPSLLVLDEPTNHLDLDMCHALEVALQAYSGALLLVSHDRHLLRNSVDELLLVHDGRVEPYEGDLDSYANWLLQEISEARADSGSEQTAATASRREQRQQAAAQRQKLKPIRDKLAAAERAMAQCESELQGLQDQLSDSGLYEPGQKERLTALLQEESGCKLRMQAAEEDWLSAQEALEAFETADSAGG